jgi:tetratricopeptide (TPR) repeat protein
MALQSKGAWGRWWLALAVVGGIGLLGCTPSPSGEKAKEKKEAQPPLSPQAMEHFRQAHKFLGENKLDEALKEFQEAVRLSPDAPLPHFWLARAYFFKQDKENCEKELKKVLDLDPKNYHAMALLGRLYSFDRAKLDQAQKYLADALDQSPDHIEAHFDLGRVLAMKGDRKGAMREFAYTFSKEGDFALYHFEMGRILEAWGDQKAALSHYKRALVLNPQFNAANQAVKRVEEAIKTAPPKPEALKSSAPPAAPPMAPKGGKK